MNYSLYVAGEVSAPWGLADRWRSVTCRNCTSVSGMIKLTKMVAASSRVLAAFEKARRRVACGLLGIGMRVRLAISQRSTFRATRYTNM